MLFSLPQSFLPLQGWCASPKGCYPTDTATTTAPVPVETIPAEEIPVEEIPVEESSFEEVPVEEIPVEPVVNSGVVDNEPFVPSSERPGPIQEMINNSIDYFISASMGKMLEIALYIVGAIILFSIVKKLISVGIAKAKDLNLTSKASDAAKAYSNEKKKLHAAQLKRIEEAKAMRRNAVATIANDSEYGEAFNALEEVLVSGKSFYEQEISKQDTIQSRLERSLGKGTANQPEVDMGAPDLSLSSLRTYDSETKSMFTTKPADELFSEYNDIGDMADMAKIDIDTDFTSDTSKASKAHKKAMKEAFEQVEYLVDENGQKLPVPPESTLRTPSRRPQNA